MQTTAIVWPGQVWADEPGASAVTRTFLVLSLHKERDSAVVVPPESAAYALCRPLGSASAGLGGSWALESFFAEVKDFQPDAKRYQLLTLDPAWPAQSDQIVTPIGTFHEQEDRFFWTDNEGYSYVSGPNGNGLFRWEPERHLGRDGSWVEVVPAADFRVSSMSEFTKSVHHFMFDVRGDSEGEL